MIVSKGWRCCSRRRMEDDNMWPAEVLKAVFPLLGGQDLGSCMCVCKQWRDVARDDFLWKQLCARRWPSVLSSSKLKGSMAMVSSRPFFRLFSVFCKKTRARGMPSPKLKFEDLEFYVDIWSDSQPLYSTVVPGPLALERIGDAPLGINSQTMADHLHSENYKLTVAVSPRFSVKMSNPPKVSMLLRRRDDERVACLIDMSSFDYVDGRNLAHAFDYLQISPLYPFVSPIRAWVALLLLDSVGEEQEVFGIELDFVEAANNDREVLCLLEILDWKCIG